MQGFLIIVHGNVYGRLHCRPSIDNVLGRPYHRLRETKYECEILDGGGDCMCVGVRTADNCYGLTPSNSNKCVSAKIDQVD